MTTKYKIEDAYIRNVNGSGTCKEVVMETQTQTNDDDGKFMVSRQICMDVPFDTDLDAAIKWIGKSVTLTIE